MMRREKTGGGRGEGERRRGGWEEEEEEQDRRRGFGEEQCIECRADREPELGTSGKRPGNGEASYIGIKLGR